VLLERVVWDERIMTIVVRLVNDKEEGRDAKEQWASVNRVAHVTVGTTSPSVKPKESNDLLANWLDGGDKAKRIEEEKVKGHVVLDGVVKGILQKF
jgi:tRNA ligase